MTLQIESQRAKVADQLREEEEQDRERERERQEKMELDGSTAGGGEIGAQEASEERSEDVEMVERDATQPEEKGGRSPKRSDVDRRGEEPKERSASPIVSKESEEKSASPTEELDVKENDKEHGDPPANEVEMSSLMGPGGDVVDYEVEDADEEGK